MKIYHQHFEEPCDEVYFRFHTFLKYTMDYNNHMAIHMFYSIGQLMDGTKSTPFRNLEIKTLSRAVNYESLFLNRY